MFRFRLVVWRLGSVAQRLGGLRFGLRVGSLGHRGRMGEMWFRFRILKWEFPEIRVPYLGVLLIRILLFRAPHSGPLFSETPICFWAEHLTLSFESLELPGPKASKPRAGFPLFLSRTRHTINTQTLTSYKHNKKTHFAVPATLEGCGCRDGAAFAWELGLIRTSTLSWSKDEVGLRLRRTMVTHKIAK